MVKKILPPIFILVIFIYLIASIKPVLLLHWQQTPYFTTGEFLKEFTHYPGDMGIYLQDLSMQLLHSNLMGSVLILILASSLSILLYTVFSKLNQRKSIFLIILPFALTISVFHDYRFPMVILLQTVFLFVSVFLMTQLKKAGYGLIIGFYILFYYLFGSGAAIIYSVSGIIIILSQSISRNSLIKSMVLLLTSVLLPVIAYYFIFNLSPHQAFFQFTPEVPITQRYIINKVLYLFIFVLPVVLLVNLLVTKISQFDKFLFISNSKVQMVYHILVYCVMIGFIFFTANKHNRNIVQADFDCYNGNYDKVIDLALQDTTYDISINVNYNRAIDNKGQFINRFFDYPQLLGDASLWPDRLKTPVYYQNASDYYYDINYISKSQHMAYGILTIEPYNIRALKQVVKTNIILGNYSAAQTFLNVLANNPLSKDFVLKYEAYIQDTNKIVADPVIQEKRKLMPDNFAIPGKITDRLIDLVHHDSTNVNALEHLEICFLLEQNLADFIKYFNTSIRSYKQVPQVYEQAWLMYIYSTRTGQNLLSRIGTDSKNKFSYFMKTMAEYNNDTKLAKKKLSDQSNTYMYYVTFLSPKVTHLELKITND